MSTRLQVRIIAAILAVTGVVIAGYKHFRYGFPVVPGGAAPVWHVEAEITFTADSGPVRVSLALPPEDPRFAVIGENFSSPGFSFRRRETPHGARAVWTGTAGPGLHKLYYRVQLQRTARPAPVEAEPAPAAAGHAFLGEAEALAAVALLERLRGEAADAADLAARLVRLLADPAGDEEVGLLLGRHPGRAGRLSLALALLGREGVPARLVRGLRLAEGRRFQPVVEHLEVWSGREWVFCDADSGALGIPDQFLRWQSGGPSLLDVEGGQGSRVRFSILRDSQPAGALALQRAEAVGTPLYELSIYALPLEEQNVFKRLLLVPVGALVMVVLRNVVGILTSGTFMPVLIALAFQETRLLPGVVLFLLIVGTGLALRSALSHLNLLVVPRVTAVVIMVILLMAALSVASHKLQLAGGMKVTFFPMIIIAWTIERLSILWEEEGGRSALLQGAGSLLVAVAAHGAMSIPLVRHLSFTFPELLLVILGVTLLLGQYTGYRLTELRRFEPLLRNRA